jgi:predicted CoA-substrate-specific enzyme activase
MSERRHFLGIDIGSVSISVVVIDEAAGVIHTSYAFHRGQIAEQLDKALDEVDISKIKAVGYTSSTPDVLKTGHRSDTRVAFIKAAKHFHPDLNALLIIGAEKFGLVTFDQEGDYLNFKSNTSCAAGTGNFLDQQVERLNLKSIMEFSDIAYNNTGNLPLIASRCAVFAKTDLIHVQQEGYSLAEICDGLSFGLAKNIVDAVGLTASFASVVASGGVALNKAVLKHIEKLAGVNITVDGMAHMYGAAGAALCCMEDDCIPEMPVSHKTDIVAIDKKAKKLYYPPLRLELSEYPDFNTLEQYEFTSTYFTSMKAVEVDLYVLPEHTAEVYLGLDIGSTSTKAVLLNRQKEVVAGLYTRTAGQPLQAAQCIFETISDIEAKHNMKFTILGAGTTGSGRKFIGKILGADSILDEITAHARAAYELDPDTDTIIEIGGQDSKFTVMHNGMVTFSVMNNVCAAGTGSFIEEQAKRLNCPLREYSERAANASAPLSSDRCTVFMERDLNYFLNAGYTVDEILAAVLHSTRENYLSKVAITGSIGKKIFFQGATAKNKALVATFEMKLKKPIMVSKFCHLTGALGAALELLDKNISNTRFRGLDLYKKDIPILSETCTLCTNHCKLKVANIDGDTEAYGFLCGRDYATHKFVSNKTAGFQLINKRKDVFRFKSKTMATGITIGIPAGLHLAEDVLFWRKFFDLLNIRTVSSEDLKTSVRDGKNLISAEFCAPISAMHGHVNYVFDKVDYIFLPIYLEEDLKKKKSNQYCYYTQFISSIVSVQKSFQPKEKFLTPTLKMVRGGMALRMELQRMLKSIKLDIGLVQVTLAFNQAQGFMRSLNKKWRDIYTTEVSGFEDIHVMLLGRPYTVLTSAMNNHIPEIIEKNGVKAFFMDMLPPVTEQSPSTAELLDKMKWKFASKILDAAELIAKTENCYPVLVTSFKCTPDSFVIEYFKEILNTYKKPYLILQLDEHDSTVGYETRIESGIRAFRNHHRKHVGTHKVTEYVHDPVLTATKEPDNEQKWNNYIKSLKLEAQKIMKANSIDFKLVNNPLKRIKTPKGEFSEQMIKGPEQLAGKILLLPCWDQLVGPLLEAVLQNIGVDARMVNSTQESMVKSLSYNTGQCLPLNIIVQNAIDYIQEHKLDPKETVIWNINSNLSCNLSMFPYFSKKLLNDQGNGLENVQMYLGDVVFYDFSLQTAINAYLAYMFGGLVRKMACLKRPYEKNKGETDRVIARSMPLLYDMFRHSKPKEPVIDLIVADFEAIETTKRNRPKVAVFGDLYVRDNDMMNQDLIQMVEDNGGEVITTSYSEYMKIIIEPFMERLYKEGRYFDYVKHSFLKSISPLVENKFNKYFNRVLGTTITIPAAETLEWLDRFGLNIMHRGEALENILKIHSLVKNYPDLDLFIQTNPSYCCPSLVTEAMTAKIEEVTGIPVVTIEYDGTTSNKNENVIPYLKFRKKKKTKKG